MSEAFESRSYSLPFLELEPSIRFQKGTDLRLELFYAWEQRDNAEGLSLKNLKQTRQKLTS